jgi:hypothetical protein
MTARATARQQRTPPAAIVKQGNEQIWILTLRCLRDKQGDLEKMVDMGLPPCGSVPSRGRIGDLQDSDPLFY